MKDSKRKKPSYFGVIISVALVLFLLGFFGLFLIQAQNWVQQYKESVNLLVEVKEDSNNEELNRFINNLNDLAYIKTGSVKFVGKEEIAKEMSESLGSESLDLVVGDPYYDVIHFNLKADYLKEDSLVSIRQQLLQSSIVSDVFYQDLWIDQINKNLNKVGWGALILSILFIIISVVLIHNTIRLSMYSNRFLIKNMQLVGATWGFISKPYLKKSLINGIWSAVLAILFLSFIVVGMNQQLPQLEVSNWAQEVSGLVIMFIGIFMLGILISVSSTYFVVNKYLKMRLDDLY